MGKFTDFLKSDAGATSSSDPATASHRSGSHHDGRSGSLSSRNNDTTDSVAASRKDAVGDYGSRGQNSVAADSLGEMSGNRHGSTGTRNHESTGGRVAEGAEELATGRRGHGHDVDGDGLDDRSTGNKERKIGANGDFGHAHSDGHPRISKDLDLSGAEHTHAHLAPVLHEKVKHHEIEEVQRERERHDHHHHIKHAVVPIHDREVTSAVHTEHTHAPTRIEERHVNSAEDHDTFAAIGARHKNTETHHDKTREVVDLGERTRVVDHHHVHNVVQPVIEKERHDSEVVHTTIPIHHTTHQAPIVHDSVHHSPISMAEFTKRGGKLDSTTTHADVGKSVLAATECERKVDGPAEGLMSKLHLK